MTIQINIGDHTSTETGYIAFPKNIRPMANWARSRAITIARTFPSANVYFRSLPNGRSLTQLLGDNSIWVNYHATMPYFGEAVLSGTEIAISNLACRMGRWALLATLIHEIAHINGAPGGSSTQAEEALLSCGLGRRIEQTSGNDDPKTPYDPNIRG